MEILAIVWDLVKILLGLGRKPGKDERHENTARDLGRQEARADAAEKVVVAQKKAMDLETRMVEAQAQIQASQPPAETPHEGMDLFHQD